eukprot:4283086-Pleurochrysis_carterae.AAC.1
MQLCGHARAHTRSAGIVRAARVAGARRGAPSARRATRGRPCSGRTSGPRRAAASQRTPPAPNRARDSSAARSSAERAQTAESSRPHARQKDPTERALDGLEAERVQTLELHQTIMVVRTQVRGPTACWRQACRWRRGSANMRGGRQEERVEAEAIPIGKGTRKQGCMHRNQPAESQVRA